jgi:hypothetical protein
LAAKQIGTFGAVMVGLPIRLTKKTGREFGKVIHCTVATASHCGLHNCIQVDGCKDEVDMPSEQPSPCTCRSKTLPRPHRGRSSRLSEDILCCRVVVGRQENGFFEAVVGSVAAREMKAKLGDSINSTHGDPDPEVGKLHSEESFKVVGILKSTGTANDRAVFVNMEGFYLLEGHAKPVEGSESVGGSSRPHRSSHGRPLLMAQREKP